MSGFARLARGRHLGGGYACFALTNGGELTGNRRQHSMRGVERIDWGWRLEGAGRGAGTREAPKGVFRPTEGHRRPHVAHWLPGARKTRYVHERMPETP